MQFDIAIARPLLARSPGTLRSFLHDLPNPWTEINEGPDTWTVFDVFGHLIHGEKTDWIPPARTILEHGASRLFDPFDRSAQFETSRAKSHNDLLDEFEAARASSLSDLDAMRLTPELLNRKGLHPGVRPGDSEPAPKLLGGSRSRPHRTDGAGNGDGLHRRRGPWRAYLRVLKEPLRSSD